MNRNSFQSSGVNLSQVNMNTQNINNLTRAITKLRNEISTSFIKLSDTPYFFGAAGQVVAVNSTRTGLEFVNQTTGGGGGGGGSTTLSGLTDTDTSTSSDNHLLQYNSTSQLWENVGDLTLPGTLNVTAHTTLGSASAANISLSSFCYINNNLHEIFNDVTFRGDTYIRKQGTNGDVGFYCNTQTNPPRVGIRTTEPDDALTVEGGFGIRSGTAANSVVPLLTANSAFGQIVTNGEMSDADGSYLVTFNNDVSIQNDLKVVGSIQLGQGADEGTLGYVLSSNGPGQTPRWADRRQQIVSFVLKANVLNNVVPQQVIPWSSAPSGHYWEEKVSAPFAGPAYLQGKIYYSTNTIWNNVILDGDPALGSYFLINTAGKYRITTRVTFEVRTGFPGGAPQLGQKQNIELRELGTNTLLDVFDFYYQQQDQLIMGKGECIIITADTTRIQLSINCSNAQSVLLLGAQGSDPEKAAYTYINIEKIDDFP